MRTLLSIVAVLIAVLPLSAGGPCNNAAAILPTGNAVYQQQTITYSQPVPTIQQVPVASYQTPACAPCGVAAATYQQQPSYDVAALSQLLQQCQQLTAAPVAATYAVPAASYSVPIATYAAPVYQSNYAVRSFAPTYAVRSFAPSYGGAFATVPGRFAAPVFAPRIVGHSGQLAAFNPGGFRAGFSGAGLNTAGGSGFLTGGGLLGGAANFLGVSSGGLEGAALGILATRSNLFGLARKR
jgi:hypothetical protein